ncbi:3887_t:CDS:2, partial [Racocetra persica]
LGTLIFELQLESVKKAHEAKHRELKPIDNCSNSTILKWAKKFGNRAFELLKSESQNYYSKKDFTRRLSTNNCTNIKIIQVSLDFLEVDSINVENIDPEIEQETINIAKISVQRSIKDLFNYIIPYLEQNENLKYSDSIVHLRISENGHNVGCKTKHIIIIIMILNGIKHQYNLNFHYTTVLYLAYTYLNK